MEFVGAEMTRWAVCFSLSFPQLLCFLATYFSRSRPLYLAVRVLLVALIYMTSLTFHIPVKNYRLRRPGVLLAID